MSQMARNPLLRMLFQYRMSFLRLLLQDRMMAKACAPSEPTALLRKLSSACNRHGQHQRIPCFTETFRASVVLMQTASNMRVLMQTASNMRVLTLKHDSRVRSYMFSIVISLPSRLGSFSPVLGVRASDKTCAPFAWMWLFERSRSRSVLLPFKVLAIA